MSFLVGVPGKLKTIIDALTALAAALAAHVAIWTSTLATNLGTTNTSVATLLSRLTAERAANLDDVGGYIYVQRGREENWNGTSKNITISAVTMNRSFVNITVESEAATFNNDAACIAARLTSTTNLQLTRYTNTLCSVNWEVMEWKTS